MHTQLKWPSLITSDVTLYLRFGSPAFRVLRGIWFENTFGLVSWDILITVIACIFKVFLASWCGNDFPGVVLLPVMLTHSTLFPKGPGPTIKLQ